LVSALDGPEKQTETYFERLNHARIEGPGIALAYMADDKAHVNILTAQCNLIERSDVLFLSSVTERARRSTSPVGFVGFDG
jgi:hypothetical protein